MNEYYGTLSVPSTYSLQHYMHIVYEYKPMINIGKMIIMIYNGQVSAYFVVVCSRSPLLIIVIKICSAHISTLLGAQGAETEKT